MGSFTPNLNLYEPSVGETGWGTAVNTNFTTLDQALVNPTPVITGTVTANGLVDLSAVGAGQIKFPATQNPSANPNTLDDYEEGTWTPTLGGTTTYTVQTGAYTKIGRSVHLSCTLTINTIGTGSTLQISGLPFPAVRDVTSAVYWSSAATALVACTARTLAATSVVVLASATAAATGLTSIAVFGNGTTVEFSLTYDIS